MELPTDNAFKLPSVPEPKHSKPTGASIFGGASLAAEEHAANESLHDTAAAPIQRGETIQIDTPSWTKPPPADKFTFSVIKSGTVIEAIKLQGKERFLIGRKSEDAEAAACDIPTEHPSCSRNHAVLFYGTKLPAESHDSFYLVDLNSAHGTLVNKTKLLPGVFCRLECGYVVKFGASSRIMVLEGPATSNPEPDVDAVVAGRAKHAGNNTKKEFPATEQRSATWGIADDDDDFSTGRKKQRLHAAAGQSEETDRDEAADDEEAQIITDPIELEERAAYYRDDPKAILTKWFEIMGYEMDVAVDEQNAGTKAAKYVARLELPHENFDGTPLVGNAVANRKKEAIHQACLDACRLLDMRRALRETIQSGAVGGGESERVRKAKRLAANDFYDDEEDAFFDRTDELQIRRARRMQRIAAETATDSDTGPKPENFDSLQLKVGEIEREIEELNAKLERNSELAMSNPGDDGKKSSGSTVDALDAFISGLRKGILLDPKEKSKTKQRLVVLRAEKTKLQALIKLVRPALPLLPKVDFAADSVTSAAIDERALVPEENNRNCAAVPGVDISAAVSKEPEKGTAMSSTGPTISRPQDNVVAPPPLATRAVAREFLTDEKMRPPQPLPSFATCSTSTETAPSSSGLKIQFQRKSGRIQAPLPEPGAAPSAFVDSSKVADVKKKVHPVTARIQQTISASSSGDAGKQQEDDRTKYNMWIPPKNAEKTSL